MAELGLAQRDQATLQALTQEVITTSAIEGEALNLDAVRSSIARRLGVDIGAIKPFPQASTTPFIRRRKTQNS